MQDPAAKVSPPNRFCKVTLASLALLSFISLTTAERASDRRPSVVLIVLDTVRADHLGLHGYPRATSPQIDSLAQESILFDNAYTVMPHTLPSHLALFTSRYPRELGVLSNGQIYEGKSKLLPEILQENGYSTAAFVSGLPVHSRFGLNRGFETYHDGDGWKTPGDSTLEAFSDWLSEAPTRPFFAWVHLYDAHVPYSPPAEMLSRFQVDDTLETWVRQKQIEIQPEWGQSIDSTTIRKKPSRAGNNPFLENLNFYDAEVRHADNIAGRIVNLLRQRGLLDSTILILTSDHGEGLGEHDYYFHGLYLYEEQIRIPLLIRLPSGKAGGTRFNGLVSILDIGPTLVDLLGVEADNGFRGMSLATTMEEIDERALKGRRLYFESREYRQKSPRVDASISRARRFGTRDKRWKAILSMDDDLELYDLTKDPEEQINLADKNKAQAAKHRALIENWMEAIVPPDNVEPPQLTDEEKRRLRSLGYASPGHD